MSMHRSRSRFWAEATTSNSVKVQLLSHTRLFISCKSQIRRILSLAKLNLTSFACFISASVRFCVYRFLLVCQRVSGSITSVYKFSFFFSLSLPSHWMWRLLHKTMTLLKPRARWRVTWLMQRPLHQWILSKFPKRSPWIWTAYMKPLLLACASMEAFMDLTRT